MAVAKIDQQVAGNEPRTVSARLAIGITLLPYVFAWFLLRKGYSRKARTLGLGWMAIVMLLISLGQPPVDEAASSSQTIGETAEIADDEAPVAVKLTKLAPVGKNEAEYIALLDQVLATGRKTGLIRDEGNPEVTWAVALGTIGTMTDIYLEGDKYALTDKGKAAQKSYLRELAQIQSRSFPKLRAIYGKALGGRVWEHDVDVTISGNGNRTVRLTGFWFASNGNIKQIMESMQADALALRFSRVEFRSHKLDDTTYYDLDPLSDPQLATFAYNKWTPVAD